MREEFRERGMMSGEGRHQGYVTLLGELIVRSSRVTVPRGARAN